MRELRTLSKKALIIGGANGLGAAVVQQLLDRDAELIFIADREEPCIGHDRIKWIPVNLANDDLSDLKKIDVDTLIITAGVGRLCFFEDFTESEIANHFQVNTISAIKVIRMFYDKINAESDFFCAVLTSIAGMLSSPLYSIYSASKAALARFAESVNAELAGRGRKNRILTVAPGKIEGTRFHGEQSNDLSRVLPLAGQILEHMYQRDMLYIPDEEVYQKVLERYYADPIAFGQESLQYKLSTAKIQDKPTTKKGYLSGTFDLFHIGHLNLLKRAKSYCDYLVVGVHADASHKGKEVFIPLDERLEILKSIQCVDEVLVCPSEDSDAYPIVKYDYLFVGSDYKGTARFERYENELGPKGVKIVYFPYTQGTSSTQLRDRISR